MSIPPPNDPTEPTRPLPSGFERERVVDRVVEPEFDPRPALIALEDSVRSLRTGMILLGLLAVGALALAFYALLQAEEDDRATRGADDGAEVTRLQERVDGLEEDVRNRETADPDAVEQALEGKADAKDVQALEQAIGDLQDQQGQAEQPATDPETAQAIEDIGTRLDDLEQRMEQQEQQAP